MDHELARSLSGAITVGVGATAIMDLWAITQKRLFGVASLDYRFVGRWVGHFREGRFVHDGIGKAAPVRGEAAIGWIVHYAIGIAYAGVLVILWPAWLRQPTLLPTLVVGIGSVVAPFFVMQPAFGMGIAASRTPRPWLSRFRSLLTHASFAIGLFAATCLWSHISVQ